MADVTLSRGECRVRQSTGGIFGDPDLWVRRVLGAVLLIAAALKAYQLASEPFLTDEVFGSRWPLVVLVELEFFLGLWLMASVLPKWSWLAAVCCFTVFGVASLYKVLSGATSCGCFGDVPVNPWFTLVLDSAAIAALLSWRPNLYGTECYRRSAKPRRWSLGDSLAVDRHAGGCRAGSFPGGDGGPPQ